MRYHLNLGTNMEPRVATLQRAVALLAACGDVAVSRVVHSAPWGYRSVYEYLNIGVRLDSRLAPHELLRVTQGVERRLGSGPHRHADGTYRDRLIDIDIVACDEFSVHTDTLTLPHPHMAEREFVLRPLAQLAPYWRHPATGHSVRRLLAAFRERTAVRGNSH